MDTNQSSTTFKGTYSRVYRAQRHWTLQECRPDQHGLLNGLQEAGCLYSAHRSNKDREVGAQGVLGSELIPDFGGEQPQICSWMSFDGCVKLKAIKCTPKDIFIFEEFYLIDASKQDENCGR